MAITQNLYEGDNSTTNYAFTFPYLKQTDIKVQLDADVTTAWSLANATTVAFDSAPDTGVKIKIYRETDTDTSPATFYAGSSIKSEDLNDNFTQNLYSNQEVNARYLSNLGGTMTGSLNMGEDAKLIFEGATDNDYETTLYVADPTADRTITLPNVTGTVVTTGDTGTVTSTMIADGTVTSTDIADGTIATGDIANDAITNAKIATDAVNADSIAANSVGTSELGSDAVTGAQLADNAVDSEHYVDGSIDTAHIADSQITSAKIADGTIVDGDIANTTITGGKLASNTLTHTQLADNAVTTGKLTDDCVTAAKIADATIVDALIADTTITGGKLASSTITHTQLAANAVTTGKVTADAITSALIADDQIDSEHYVDGSIDTAHIADANVTLAKVENVTDGNIIVGNGSNRPASVAVSGDITIANTGAVTIANDAVEIGMIGCEQTTITDSDSHIPTSGAVVDYVGSIIAPIGGLEVIADDESFPNTIPAAGVVISITDAAGLQVNSSGVSTNGDALDNSTITINGFPSELRGGVGSNPDPYVFQSGAGLMVVSTGASQTYNYHQAMIRESDFVQLSDDINDFNSRYRIHAGEPGSDNDEGDLVFDTNANKMKVYDGSSWGEVTSTGDFKFLVAVDTGTTTAATFDGNDTSFDLKEATNSGSAASVTNINQLMIVLNGVVQKPNAGSWSSSGEGFYLTDGDTIRFATAPPTGSTCFIIQSGSAVSIPTPGDGTVTAAKIANGAVVAAGIGTGAVELAKMAANSVDSDQYVDGSIDTAHIADNQVTLDKLADGTQGGILYYGASGAPTQLAAGTSGYFLKTQGSGANPVWAEVAVPKLAVPTITGDLEVADGGTVTHTITNYDAELTYTFSSLSNCTIGTINTSNGQFVVTETGDHPSYTVKAETDALGLEDSITVTKNIKTKLSAPTLSSPADGPTATNVVYTITSTHANDNKLILDIGSSNFTYQSVSHGSGSKVGNTVEVTGFSTNNPAVTIQFTAEATYSVTAKAQDTGGTWADSVSSSADSIEIANTYDVDFLMIAGGGAGGSFVASGGGGAGGYRNSYSTESSGANSSSESPLALAPGTEYTISVGAGAPPNPGGGGVVGTDSFISGSGFTTVTSEGGGGCDQDGGSGGGKSRYSGSGGAGTANQGKDGGDHTGGNGQDNAGGGGGGASADGADNNGYASGAGGAGLSSSITGSAVTSAGGGGGGATAAPVYGSGGTGGGGAGMTAGTANTGGGGGGGNSPASFSNVSGKSGGSGIVIIRYRSE